MGEWTAIIIAAILGIAGTLMAKFISSRPASSLSPVAALVNGQKDVRTEIELLKQADMYLGKQFEAMTAEIRLLSSARSERDGKILQQLEALTQEQARVAAALLRKDGAPA